MIKNNLDNVTAYLARAIREERLFAHCDDIHKEFAAKKSFQELNLGAHDKEDAVTEYGQWIEKYLTEKQWTACQAALRQKALDKKRKRKYKRYRLSGEVCRQLTYYADIKQITKTKALEEIINKAYLKC